MLSFANVFLINLTIRSQLKVNNRNTRTRCEICSKLTIKIPERCVSITNFEHVIAGWISVIYLDQNLGGSLKNIKQKVHKWDS